MKIITTTDVDIRNLSNKYCNVMCVYATDITRMTEKKYNSFCLALDLLDIAQREVGVEMLTPQNMADFRAAFAPSNEVA